MDRDRSLRARGEQVLQADVREGAAYHHLVVAAAGAVGIEVPRLDAVGNEVLAGGAGLPDRAGRRDVIRGDTVAQQAEDTRATNVLDRPRRGRHAVEVGRTADVG